MKHVRQASRFVWSGLVVSALLLGASCSVLTGTPEPSIIYVTATPGPEIPTAIVDANTFPTAVETALFAATQIDMPTTRPTFPPLPTGTETPVPTRAPTLTPSFTPEFTDTPLPSLVAKRCKISMPPNGFTTIYQQDHVLQNALGCPQSTPVAISSAVLSMDSGVLIWVSALADQPSKAIYALYSNGNYQRFDDTWTDGVDPVDTGESPPAGHKAPIRGFGKVWKGNPTVRAGLGWAIADEAGTAAQIQRFDRGELVYLANTNTIYILTGGKWRADGTKF